MDRAGGTTSGLRERVARVGSLLTILTPREVRLRYRENVLDIAWALITPIAIMVVYGIVLTQSFDASGSCSPYLSSAWTGLVLWTFFAAALGAAVWSLLSAADLMTKIYFPREALPLSVVGAALVDLGIGMVTVFLVALLQGVSIGVTAVSIVVPLAVLILWTAAFSIFASVGAVFLRDVTQAVQLFLRVGFFATPVMYEPELLPGPFRWTADVNPLAVAIQGVRDPVLCGRWPNGWLLTAHLATGAVALVLAVLYVRSVEDRMTDVI